MTKPAQAQPSAAQPSAAEVAAFDAALAAARRLFEETNAARLAIVAAGPPEYVEQLDVITQAVFRAGASVLRAHLPVEALVALDQMTEIERSRVVAVAWRQPTGAPES